MSSSSSSKWLPKGCEYIKFLTHVSFCFGVFISWISLHSCRFLNVQWVGDDNARVSGVGLYSFRDHHTHTCISYWSKAASKDNDTDVMTLLDGMHFFFGLSLGAIGFICGCLVSVLMLVHYCKAPSREHMHAGADFTPELIQIRGWSRFFAILAIIGQAGAIGAMFLTVPGEHVCNATFSTCRLGVGGILSCMATGCYIFGTSLLFYWTWCGPDVDRAIDFPNHYMALNTDNELGESLILPGSYSSDPDGGSMNHQTPYNYGDLPPWVNPANSRT